MTFYEFGDYRFMNGGLKPSQTEKVRIKANGNVGIGINNPVSKLDINGNLCIQGTCISGIQLAAIKKMSGITTNPAF
jgi:hypothetical protein